MQTPNPFTREDTMLGVCQAIGDEFGFNPVILRVAFGVLLFWNIQAAIAAYLGIGVVVLAARLLMPARVVASPPAQVAPRAENDDAAEELPLAA